MNITVKGDKTDEMEQSMNKPLVIYHKNCMDGFTAAWVAWKVHMDAADYLAASYGDDPPDVSNRSWVVIVDFSYPREDMLKMAEQLGNRELIVLDHHKTAQADCAGLDFCTFDMGKSGAMLAWEWFNPYDDIPPLVQYVQDRDLWRFELPHSKAISAFLQSCPMNDFTEWDRLNAQWDTPSYRRIGEGILRYQQKSIDQHIVRVTGRSVDIPMESDADPDSCLCPFVNCTDMSIVSELLHQLASRDDSKMAVSWMEGNGKKTFSIRSTDDGPDVGEIAKLQGGGGHKHAAGWVEVL